MLEEKKNTRIEANRGKERCFFFSSFTDERRQEHHNKTSITKSTLFKSNTAKVVTTIDRPKEWERYMIKFYVCQHQKSTNPKEQERRKKKNYENTKRNENSEQSAKKVTSDTVEKWPYRILSSHQCIALIIHTLCDLFFFFSWKRRLSFLFFLFCFMWFFPILLFFGFIHF